MNVSLLFANLRVNVNYCTLYSLSLIGSEPAANFGNQRKLQIS